jgi:hypothetical protein
MDQTSKSIMEARENSPPKSVQAVEAGVEARVQAAEAEVEARVQTVEAGVEARKNTDGIIGTAPEIRNVKTHPTTKIVAIEIDVTILLARQGMKGSKG